MNRWNADTHKNVFTGIDLEIGSSSDDSLYRSRKFKRRICLASLAQINEFETIREDSKHKPSGAMLALPLDRFRS